MPSKYRSPGPSCLRSALPQHEDKDDARPRACQPESGARAFMCDERRGGCGCKREDTPSTTPPCAAGTLTIASAMKTGKPMIVQTAASRNSCQGRARRHRPARSRAAISVRRNPAMAARAADRNSGSMAATASLVAGSVPPNRALRQGQAQDRVFHGRWASCGSTKASDCFARLPRRHLIGRINRIVQIGGGPAVLPPGPLTTYQPACKPGSVWPAARAANVTAIPLARRLPGASSNLPERLIRTDPGLLPRRSYSVLLPVGFAVPFPLPETRCALTAPFHPCRG